MHPFSLKTQIKHTKRLEKEKNSAKVNRVFQVLFYMIFGADARPLPLALARMLCGCAQKKMASTARAQSLVSFPAQDYKKQKVISTCPGGCRASDLHCCPGLLFGKHGMGQVPDAPSAVRSSFR